MHIIVLLLILASCSKPSDFVKAKGKPDVPKTVRVVDEGLELYVLAFEAIHGTAIDFPVVFATLGESRAGVCYSWDDGRRRIEIHSETWDSYNEDQRYQLMFHEMGHCVLNRGHNNARITIGTDPRSLPASVMKDSMFNTTEAIYFRDYRDYYIRELLGEE